MAAGYKATAGWRQVVTPSFPGDAKHRTMVHHRAPGPSDHPGM